MTEGVAVGSGRLWLGVVLGPAVWFIAELIGYYVAARSCEPRLGGIPLLGARNLTVAETLIQGVAALLALAGLVVSIGNWRAMRGARPDAPAALGRARFMAYVGIVASALFLFGILLFGGSAFVVDACSQLR